MDELNPSDLYQFSKLSNCTRRRFLKHSTALIALAAAPPLVTAAGENDEKIAYNAR
jgi:hypothetical protein